MLRAAVLGSPVGHSLSPTLHGAGYAALGLTEWSYGMHEVDATGLAAFVRSLDGRWRGLSLTMPLKEAALEVADEVTGLARAAGAANTLLHRPDGTWLADNTDVEGIVRALRPHLPRPGDPMGDGLVLGSGATARSAVLALARIGITGLNVAARDAAKADALLRWARTVTEPAVPVPTLAAGRLDAWGALPGAVVVSALAPAAGEAVAAGLGRRHTGVLLDVVYAGWPTPLARAAAAAGLVVVPGFDMLVHQAAVQFAMFTGRPAPLAQMREAGLAALRG
jgi:shikimate dehydrogenase